mgnify:CR=1 FL=1
MIQILVKAVQLLTFCILCIKQEAEIIWSYIIFFYFGRTYAWELYTYCLPLALGVISFIVFLIIDSFKRNLQVMLNEHYSPYSEKRMQMTVKVLNTYQISIHDFEAIDLLIEEAKIAQIQCDYLAPLKKPLKTLAAIIVPIIVYVAEKIGDSTSQNEMIIMAAQITIVLLIFSLIFSITPIVKDILYRDYNKYGELIYDLRQIKLFYAKEISSSSN